MQKSCNCRISPWWLVVVLATAGLLYYLKQVGEGQIAGQRINMINLLNAWEQAGRPEGEIRKTFLQKFPAYFTTNLVVSIDGKSMQAIFATEMPGSHLLVATTNKECILLRPDQPPRLLAK